jgi:hypothetical protein
LIYRYIDAAAAERDVSVTIGTEGCNLTALANRALTCQPPSVRPTPRMLNSVHPELFVTIGGKVYEILRFYFGKFFVLFLGF